MNSTTDEQSGSYEEDVTRKDSEGDDLTRAESGRGVAGGKGDYQFPKTDFRHWEKKLFRHTYLENGKRVAAKTYSVRVAFRGQRHALALGLSNLREAAKKAQKLYMRIVVEGWGPVLGQMKPQPAKKTPATVITLGDYMAAARAAAAVSPRSLEGYCRSLRRIVAGTLGMKGDKKRFGPGNGGSKAWRERIERTPLADVSAAKVNQWALSYLKKGKDPAAAMRRKHSFNSLLRQAKGLFSAQVVERLGSGLELPNPLPLEGVKPFKCGAASMRYRSNIDPHALLKMAREELGTDPESREKWKAFLLAFLCGLRKAEIDTLTWDQIDFTRGVIRIERTKHFAPKTQDAAADVDMDPELVELLRGLKAHASGDFYLESELAPRPDAKFAFYRAANTFDALNEWLNKKGVTARKKLHELRKEAGSLLAKESGLFAAQLFLRHSSPQTTALHYLDKKQRLSTGLGKFLVEAATPDNVVPMKQEEEPKGKPARQPRKPRSS